MNKEIICKMCNERIAYQQRTDDDFPQKLQQQVDEHRIQFPDHNWFDENDVV